MRFVGEGSEHALAIMARSYFHEACHVGALHVVDVVGTILLAILYALLVDVLHDAFQLVVDLLRAPGETLGVRLISRLETATPPALAAFPGA